MSSRSRRAVSKPPPEPSGEPAREALLAALAERERELAEALQQQTATADVLKVISRATFDLPSVLDTLMETAARLCDIDSGGLTIRDGEVFRYAAFRGISDEFKAVLLARPIIPSRDTIAGRVALEGKVVQVEDLDADPDYKLPESIKLGSIRTSLGVPLLRKGAVVGTITVNRQRVAPFTERQIELLRTFADQAVIAIENARLLEAEQQRSRELAEALQQQTATADVLKVISRSAFDLQPVLETLISSAVELSGAFSGAICVRDGDVFRYRAGTGPGYSLDLQRFLEERPVSPGRGTIAARALLSGKVEEIPDIHDDPEYAVPLASLGNVSRAMLGVPLLREDRVEGALTLTLREPGRFTQRQIELVQTFADQAVIAIENVRLFDEVQARTRDLEESLAQQTATADVLKAISRTAFDLDTVLETLISTAVRLCDAKYGQIFRRHGDVYRYAASQMDIDPAYLEHEQTTEIRPGRGTLVGRVALENRAVEVADAWNDPEYAEKDQARIGNVRAMLGVPLMRNGEPIGAFALARSVPVPFTKRQVELVTTFADQAVIAIENVRLFDEVQARTRDLTEALQQQTATAEVLKAISGSAFDLQPVFETLVTSAVQLIGAFSGGICVRDGEVFRHQAFSGPGASQELHDYLVAHPATPGRGSIAGRAILSGRVEQIPDVREDPEFLVPLDSRGNPARALLGVPLIGKERIEGAIVLTRLEPGAYPQRQIEILQTFADQAVIAIENVRLFDEVQARTRDLTEALQQQTATAEVLKAISRTAFDLDTVLQTLISTAVRLCDASGGEIFRRHGDVFRYAASLMDLGPAYLEHEQKAEIRAGRGTLIGRVAAEKRTVEIADAWNDPEYAEKEEVRVGGVRAMLGVPLMRNGELIGAFALGRPAAVPFTKRQVELVTTFADQAVIAIENVRLFDEVQARTRDLEEALQQQTATADVLKVISRSAFDLQAVLRALLSSAVRLSGVRGGAIALRDGEALRVRAESGRDAEYTREILGRVITAGRGSVSGRVLLSGKVEQISDVRADPDFDLPPGGSFARLGVPMLRNGKVEGVIVLVRDEPGPFSPRVIELVQTFADQAVIAIENVRLFNEVQARTRDLTEALQQQTATAEVLKVISRSAFDLDAVLNSLTKSAVELCNSTYGVISLYKDGALKFMAQTGCTPEFAELLWSHPAELDRKTVTGRTGLLRTVVLIPDVTKDEDFDYHGGEIIGNYRSTMGVPLLRNGELEGVFTLMRREPGLFTPRQVELVQTFADQAVIAIENVRLFNEVQARTRDLSEALQQQTATADVLKVISRSAFDLQAVFDALLSSAATLCGAIAGTLWVSEGDFLRHKASFGINPEFRKFLAEYPQRPGREMMAGRVLLSGKVETIPDALEDKEYRAPTHGLIEARSILGVPLLRGQSVGGAVVLLKREPGPFSPRQIELVKTFADQAVIAIENVRLFDEVQAKTRDLSEALQQQTATAEVLKVISRSAFDLQAVWRTLVESACTLCEAPMGLIELLDGDVFRMAMQKGYGEAFERYLLETPLRAGSSSGTGRAASTGEVSHIPDVLQDPDYLLSEAQRLAGYRSNLAVPLLRENKVIGVFVLGRPTPGPFTERQIELVKTFADHAVIAIENVRLFDEVQARTRDLSEALQQQTATADVLKVISRSAFDLQPVLDTLINSAVELSGANRGAIFLRDGDFFRWQAASGTDAEYLEYVRSHPRPPGRGSVVGRVALSGRVECIADILEDREFELPASVLARARGVLGVPLLRDGKVEGVIVLSRYTPGLYSQRQIELVQTFADQAVIAIENVRLFDEVQARTRDLSEALQLQTATSDVLKVISRSAFDLRAVFETLISSAVELCGADGGTICVRDGEVFRFRASAGASQTEALTKYLEEHPATPGLGSTAGRVLLSGKVEAIPDCLEDPDYAIPMDSLSQSVRSILGVPLLRKEGIEGALVLTRKEPGHFTERQIDIVQTFADQAVIAIENVRLFDEVQARTRELAASLENLRKAQDRLIQSEKLASLGQLTAGIAHEIKNPLNFVNNFSALSRELVDELGEVLARAPLESAQREEAVELIGTIGGNLDKVVQHGKRADSIVKNMLLHSRGGSGERSSVNVNAMVEEALNLAYHGARAEKPGFNVTIAKSLDPNAGAADLFPQEITRVLLNLISNAFYATMKRKQGGSNGAYEPTVIASTRDLGTSVEIAVRDNGTGVPDEVKAKMFNPFFTTKPAGEGTGLGLSLSHDIVVKQHGGTLEILTEPGSYAQFTIVLPRKGAAA